MTSKTIKESNECKISFLYDGENIKSVRKEFKDNKILEKEIQISELLKSAIKGEKEGNTLVYPFLNSLSSKTSRPLPEPEALNLLQQCCKILKELQEQNIVHRDLKPNNLYLNDNKQLFVSDFETAISKDWPPSNTTCGTPGFMAPEQYYKPNSDWLADQYSMGATFFNILTGTLPFSGETNEEIREKQLNTQPDPSQHNAKLKKPFSELIMTMMNKNKDLRFQSIEEIYQALDSCAKSLDKIEILEDKSVKILPKKKEIPKKQNLTINILILVTALILVIVLFKSL